MNSFFALVIMKDLSLKRIWMNSSEKLISFMKENEDCKIYNNGNYQEAVLVDDKVLWKDVTEEKVG